MVRYCAPENLEVILFRSNNFEIPGLALAGHPGMAALRQAAVK
jgi:hypothetical protein